MGEREDTPGLSVRPARPHELAEIGELTVAAYRADGHLPAGSTYETHLADAASRVREAELLVAADHNDRLLGTVTVCRPGTRYAELATLHELEVRMLAVRPDARGRGVARALVTAVLNQAVAEGYRSVVLTSLDVMGTAHRLYRRLGFQRVPERDLRGARIVLWAFVLDV